nr:AAA family ATPase [uncultured Dongia sp.]
MAIGYINVSIVGTARGNSVVGLAAYVCRRNTVSQVDGADYRFAHQAGDLGAVDVLLPPGAPAAFQDPIAFCTALERAELTRPRRKQPTRWKHNAQLAKHVILALPKELTGPERRRLARDWAETQYVAHGAGCVVAHHRPDPVGSDNHHAHIIVSTREVSSNGLGNKLRELNPAFSRGASHDKANLHKEDLPATWRQFQEAWFRANGIKIQVDAPAAVSGVHLGAAKHAKRSAAFAVKRANDAAKKDASERLHDPQNLLWEATRQRATFTLRDLSRILQRHGILGGEASAIIEAALALGEAVALFDRETGQPTQFFTTRTVRNQERRIVGTAQIIAKRRMSAKRRRLVEADLDGRMPALELSAEQSDTLRRILAAPDLQMLHGFTGSDKSRLTQAARQCLEAVGYRVIGLAPTNTGACAMAVSGFGDATTIDLELLRQENPGARSNAWNKRTCLIVDDADMVDAPRYEHLLIAAAKAEARMILVGDESRSTSVERGGVFDALRERHGWNGLTEFSHQNDDWARAASDAFARGRVNDGIRAYAERGRLQWSDRLDQTIDDLVAAWVRDNRMDPGANRFVYATNDDVVDRLNTEIQAARWARRPIPPTRFNTIRGNGHLLPGDRIQFHAGNRRFEIAAGMVGTVRQAAADRISFYTDDARVLSFGPRRFKGWGLGYAGTVYRGASKVHDQVYALYDDKLAWHVRTSQIGFTRHREDLTLFVPRALAADEQALVRQMARADQNRLSLAFTGTQEAAEIAKRLRRAALKPALPLILRVRGADGQLLTFDLQSEDGHKAARGYLLTASPSQLAVAYRNVQQLARPAKSRGTAPNDAEILRRQIDGIAKRLGLNAVTGEPASDCLKHALLVRETAWHLDASGLDTEVRDSTGRYMNIAWLLFNPNLVPWASWAALGRRLRQLHGSVLDALIERLHQIRNCDTISDDMRSACALAQHLIRISRVIRDGANLTREQLRFERTIEAAPRLLWPALRFFRADKEESSHDEIVLEAPDKRVPIRTEPSNYLERIDPDGERYLDQRQASSTPTALAKHAIAVVKPPALSDSNKAQLRSKLMHEIKANVAEAGARIAALTPDDSPMKTAALHMRKDSLERQLALLNANPSMYELPGTEPSNGPTLSRAEADARALTLSGAAAPPVRPSTDDRPRDGSKPTLPTSDTQRHASDIEDDLDADPPPTLKSASTPRPKPPARPHDDQTR